MSRFERSSSFVSIALALEIVLALGGCGGSSHATTFVSAPFAGHGSIDEAYVIGAPPGEHMSVVDACRKAGGIRGGRQARRLSSLRT